MEILRAKTLDLKQTGQLTPARQANSQLNQQEALAQKSQLQSLPRRLVLELTNRCNLNCLMCGRNSAQFIPTEFQLPWLQIFEPIIDYVEEVTLMGWGEPTIHPQFPQFLHWANQHGLRKYFCTNGMRLDALFPTIIEEHADIIAVSLDGATAESNAAIRKGSDLNKITQSLQTLTNYKSQHNLDYPYTNFVFTAMKQNLNQLPDMVKRTAECGLDELKVVFLTAFDETLEKEALIDYIPQIKETFSQAIQEAERLHINLKLPYIPGEDPAGHQEHKTCYVGWRDFFLGSDGYVRPCMSTAEKLFSIEKYTTFEQMWNSPEYQTHREKVNTAKMNQSCKNCYQSSFANWNKRESFIQCGKTFSPQWCKEEKR